MGLLTSSSPSHFHFPTETELDWHMGHLRVHAQNVADSFLPSAPFLPPSSANAHQQLRTLTQMASNGLTIICPAVGKQKAVIKYCTCKIPRAIPWHVSTLHADALAWLCFNVERCCRVSVLSEERSSTWCPTLLLEQHTGGRPHVHRCRQSLQLGLFYNYKTTTQLIFGFYGRRLVGLWAMVARLPGFHLGVDFHTTQRLASSRSRVPRIS